MFIYTFISFILSSESRKQVVLRLFESIEHWYGTAYKLGGRSEKGIDCSNFVAEVYKEVFDIDLPAGVTNQSKVGKIVSDKLEPGDILFFKITDRVSHVGIYLFNNKFVHSASEGEFIGVRKNSLNERYFKDRFAYARRIIDLPAFKNNSSIKEKNFKDILIIGKNIYDKKVFNISSEFLENDPLYVEVKANKKDRDFLLSIENSQGIKIKDIEINPEDSYIQMLQLGKGSYCLKLIDQDKSLVEEKNIVVK